MFLHISSSSFQFMISDKLKAAIENSPVIASVTGSKSASGDWATFTRTTFERVARRINQEVTKKVVNSPFLVHDFLLFGQHEFENILFKHKLSGMEDFVELLRKTNHQKPYLWISGKTLQAYWNKGNAKEKKLNVLLTFLGICLEDWDAWKNGQHKPDTMQLGDSKKPENTLRLLQKHFTGCYYRYYQKTDNSPVLIKAPFIIREDRQDIIVVETRTLGHQYKSTHMVIRNGALYLDCENLDWDEKETYIFNIGFETNPKVITGVSNTLSRRGQAIAIKNVLVKQATLFDYNLSHAIEIPFRETNPGCEDAAMISFFKNSSNNNIIAPNYYTLEELALKIED